MVQRVLVVDDHSAIRKMSRRILEANAFDVATAGSIDEANELIAAIRPFDVATAGSIDEANELIAAIRPFDVAIVDYFLEKGTCGCDLIAPLRAHNPSIRVVVVSGLAESPNVMRHAYESGADHVASKVKGDWVALARFESSVRLDPAKAEVDLWALRCELMHGALLVHGGNVSRAARALGVNRTSLYRAFEKTPPPDLVEE